MQWCRWRDDIKAEEDAAAEVVEAEAAAARKASRDAKQARKEARQKAAFDFLEAKKAQSVFRGKATGLSYEEKVAMDKLEARARLC